MSQHNISGSEVFGERPFVVVRGVKTGAFRRKKAARAWVAFVAGAVVTVAVGALAVAAIVGPAALTGLG
ncbi:MAG: hypothetical protein EON94_11765 [Caulobacteraceae bacterium]|nr:MAG: hypothetical protein EON94_11765 [Caulobacteraceae bacterium]